MRRAFLVALLPLALLLAGCAEPSGSDDPAPGGPPADPPEDPTPASPTPPTPLDDANATPPGEPVEVRELESGSRSQLPYAMRLVFTEPEEWENFYQEHHERTLTSEGEAREPTPPAVDFTRERVVAITLGEKGSACWAVRVTDATRVEDSIHLTVTTYGPSPDMVCAAVVTQPYTLVAIPAGDEEVRYVDVEVQRSPPEPTPS